MRNRSLSKNILLLISLFVLASSSIISITSADSVNEEILQSTMDDVTVIRIAQYPGSSNSEKNFELIFNYTWSANDHNYTFVCFQLTKDELKGGGEHPLNADNYDLLIVGANYWSYGIDGHNPKIVNNIKKFLAEGGGFLGSCAGATFASMGHEKYTDVHAVGSATGALGVVNVYLNQDLHGEMQYCIRSKNGLPPIESLVERDTGNPIFATYADDTINLTFGGGAAMYEANIDDPLLGEVVPLLTYNEELMETMPIHNWKKRLIGWVKSDTIKTDYVGQYCGVASTYNDSGRIVIFGSHAEIPLIMNATVEERIEKRNTYSSLGIAPLPVYYLINGEYVNISHNWWIHRRAAAWIAGVPDDDLPPANELMVYMVKPMATLYDQFYFRDNEIGRFFNFSLLDPPFNFPRIQNSLLLSRIFGKFVSKRLMDMVDKQGMPIIVGDITFLAYAENSDIVEFYLDGELVHTATEPGQYHEGMQGWVYEWEFDTNDMSGVHRIELRAYDECGNYVRQGSDFLVYSL